MAKASEERLEEIERQRAAVSRDRRVPYPLMEEAVEHFKGLFPEADRIEPKLYDGRVYVEIWKDKHAFIRFY